jgi:hypothetical protein
MKETAVELLVGQLKSEVDDINNLITKMYTQYGVDILLNYEHNNGMGIAPKLSIMRVTQTVDYTK